MKPKSLSLRKVAERFGVTPQVLSKARPLIADFPEPIGNNNGALAFAESAVDSWAAGKDAGTVIRAARVLADRNAAEAHQARERFNPLCRQFVSGGFVGAEQRQQIEMKKLVARTCPKPSPRIVITIIPDWAQDQRGFAAIETKIIERQL